MEQTFYEGRACKNCGTSIPDQAHKATVFCERIELENGAIKCCKDDYHSPLRKEKEAPYRERTLFLKRMTDSLDALLDAYGASVTLEQVNQYGIELDKADTGFKDGLPVFSFVHHALELLPNQTFHLSRHV